MEPPSSSEPSSPSEPTFPSEPPSFSEPPLPLISLSQGLTASQTPPSTAPITRTSRGVARKNTFQQERLDSQLSREAQAKADNKARREATSIRN